tara:strand:- start:211 stop:348 length:138 start_codon:yes stop_codon:yes gene_type:complete
MLTNEKAHFAVVALSSTVILKLKKDFFEANFKKVTGLQESFNLGL